MTTENSKLVKKKKTLRQNEYYDMQPIFDKLYLMSKGGQNFNNLMNFILLDNNILLAYRKIKRNKGSMTKGVNTSTIQTIADMDEETFVRVVKNRINNFHPHHVRRIEIPKPDGRTRPLGIPTIEDRIVQECIKQILEPICEAKFYQHSYGFRPNRSTHHAIARFMFLANMSDYHFVVDIDIKGFFDNVNHSKLLKQLWTLGIHDKKLIKIISLMLKAEIEGIGIPSKGTPQGGILSPLLSNVVLNELDWWIASQWDTFPTEYNYTEDKNRQRAMRKTDLKEIRIIRYADDFKIMCRDYATAKKIFIATELWLKKRLDLDISPDKSKITNLKENYSDFLGFKLKLVQGEDGKYTIRSHMADKAKVGKRKLIKEQVCNLQKSPTVENVNKYNATILGLHDYYKTATMVSQDFSEIAFIVNKSLKTRLKKFWTDKGTASSTYKKFYGEYINHRKMFIAGIALFPIHARKFAAPMCFSQDITSYTVEGRQKIHDNLRFDTSIVTYLHENPVKGETTEYNDNRISLYAGQLGKCAVTGEYLQISNMEVHHIVPRELNGDDSYNNLLFVIEPVHKLIHATQTDTIEFYKNMLELDSKSCKYLNKLRSLVGNDMIVSK